MSFTLYNPYRVVSISFHHHLTMTQTPGFLVGLSSRVVAVPSQPVEAAQQLVPPVAWVVSQYWPTCWAARINLNSRVYWCTIDQRRAHDSSLADPYYKAVQHRFCRRKCWWCAIQHRGVLYINICQESTISIYKFRLLLVGIPSY